MCWLTANLKRGRRPGRDCYPDQSRHDETVLRDSESDDVATQERDLATIVREGEPTILNFDRIKDLGMVGTAGTARTLRVIGVRRHWFESWRRVPSKSED